MARCHWRANSANGSAMPCCRFAVATMSAMEIALALALATTLGMARHGLFPCRWPPLDSPRVASIRRGNSRALQLDVCSGQQAHAGYVGSVQRRRSADSHEMSGNAICVMPSLPAIGFAADASC